MKTTLARLFHRFDREVIEREIEEELRFHLELLTEQHLKQDMSLEAAKEAAIKRFGNAEQIKDQCAEISRSRHPVIRALKSSLILVFGVGVLVRIVGTEIAVTRAGDVLIMIAFLGRLLFYVRGLNPSHFASKDDTVSPLMLNGYRGESFTAFDQNRRTPLERVISDS